MKSDLSPILEQSMHNPNFLEDYMADLKEAYDTVYSNNNIINYTLDRIDNLEATTESIHNVMIQMGVDAEQMTKALTELNEALNKLAIPPAGDNPENRLPEQKEDLEIFEQIDTNFIKEPTPSFYSLTDGTLRPIFSEADEYIRGSLWY